MGVEGRRHSGSGSHRRPGEGSASACCWQERPSRRAAPRGPAPVAWRCAAHPPARSLGSRPMNEVLELNGRSRAPRSLHPCRAVPTPGCAQSVRQSPDAVARASLGVRDKARYVNSREFGGPNDRGNRVARCRHGRPEAAAVGEGFSHAPSRARHGFSSAGFVAGELRLRRFFGCGGSRTTRCERGGPWSGSAQFVTRCIGLHAIDHLCSFPQLWISGFGESFECQS